MAMHIALIAGYVQEAHNAAAGQSWSAAMRLLLAMIKHETNTFSPVPTPLARFRPLYGEAAVSAYRGTGTGLGAYLDLAAREDAKFVLPIAAGSPPSGPVEDTAYAAITECVLAAAAKGGFDGVMLDLHGAMVTESLEDGEGEFLKRLRTILPETPIAVSLDMHANLYDAIVANATVVVGYRTYPHIDTYETARLAGEILLRTIRGEVRPVMAWGNMPMLPHVMCQGTDDHPNRELQHRCAAMSAEGALAASLFTGFPHADITNAGLSAVVVTDSDRDLAERLRDELLDRAWVERDAFVYNIEPLPDSVARARAMAQADGPVVLLDHYDNCASGGTMDTTAVLAEILRQGLHRRGSVRDLGP
jgi:microcystin degradation protein MlrC